MKRIGINKMMTGLFALALLGAVSGCHKSLYEPQPPKSDEISQELKDFGFATRGDVKLNVNYNAPGFKTLVEVYDENPMQEDGKTKKLEAKPIYAAYTDVNGKLEASMYIPTAIKEAYLYTNCWGLPMCVKLETSANGMTYNATKNQRAEAKVGTRAPYAYVIGDKQPYSLRGREDGVMTLGRFDRAGYLAYDGSYGTAPSDYTPNYISNTTEIKNELVSELSTRAQAYFTGYEGKREELLRPANVTNIKTVKESSLDVVFLTEMGEFLNTFGYYYYEAGKAPKTEEEFKAMKKYIVFPHIDELVLQPGNTVRLKYFGTDGTADASEKFPANMVIGWFLISDGWDNFSGEIRWWHPLQRNFFFSNDEGKNMRFVAVKDAKTGIVVLGCEDEPEDSFDREKEDYTDVLFFVKTDDGELDDEDKPEIPDPEETPDATLSLEGTLAFEDVWPAGGDYDMNDVALTYLRKISFNKDNKVTAVEETFEFIQREGAAVFNNYFAYQVENMGVLDLPAGWEKEEETNSIILTMSSKELSGKSFTIKRTFEGTVKHDVIAKDFNPYITINDKGDGRSEVHLPTFPATVKANQSELGTEKDAYYMDKEGAYPFAIDIPKKDFVLSQEKVTIDKTYQRFASWAASYGKTDEDWYKDTPLK